MIYLASVIVSFCAVFLKGFQHKNVIGNHIRAVFCTSYAVALFEVVSVGLIIRGTMWIAMSAGTGAAFGMVAAIKFHDRVFTPEGDQSCVQKTSRLNLTSATQIVSRAWARSSSAITSLTSPRTKRSS